MRRPIMTSIMKKAFGNRKNLIRGILAGIVALYLLLLIPPSSIPPSPPGKANPFVWNQDDYWTYLESVMEQARLMDPAILTDSICIELANLRSLLDSCRTAEVDPSSLILQQVERAFFEVSPLIAVQTNKLPELIDLRNQLRVIIKNQSRHWI
jgi:hypothetical protein